MKRGMWAAVAAYLIWAVNPLYFKALLSVPSLQILAHRIIWSLVLLAGVVSLRREWGELKRIARGWRTLGIYFLAALMLAVNWGVYIAAVNTGRVVEASLGYFINPLINVFLGATLLHERLRPVQWMAIGLATLGVIYMSVAYGDVPWIGLVLAFSFGLYGLIKRMAPLGPVHSLTVETGFLFLPALGFLIFSEVSGGGVFGHADPGTNFLLLMAGVVTSTPLLLFSVAARSISFTLLGVLQYISPTAQLLIGVFLYAEPFTADRAVGFILIWAGLLIFTLEGTLRSRNPLQAQPQGKIPRQDFPAALDE